MKSVFDFDNYKDYLSAFEEARKSFERGFRSKLAEQMGCQSGYISHVLNGNAHLSLEQTLKAAQFFKLNNREKKYFLLLVEYARAGTKELKEYFKLELEHCRDESLNIKNRVGSSKTLSESDQSIYYSNWQYLAIHVLCSLKGYNDVKSISRALAIPEHTTAQILLFLTQTGITIEEKGKLKPGMTQIHLNRESPLIFQHHTNWRMAAVQSFTNKIKTDVHYSTVSTLSQKDVATLRSKMVNLIEDYVETVKPSPEEAIYGFNLDFFSLIK